MNDETTSKRLYEALSLLRRMGVESYVVGGTVRDLLLERDSVQDMDVAVNGPGFDLAEKLAEALSESSFVGLDRLRGAGRVIVERGSEAGIDLSSFKGEDILEDLTHRDFTINALAIPLDDFLNRDFSGIIDPLGGRGDLEAGVLRPCSRRCIEEDPLRILRAFRFHAQLGMRLDRQAIDLMEAGLGLLESVSGERKRDEFLRILSVPHSYHTLLSMGDLGALEALFEEMTLTKKVGQNEYHHLDVWGHTLETVKCMEGLLNRVDDYFPDSGAEINAYLSEEPVRGRTKAVLLKLAALFHDIGKPHTISRDENGRLRFFGHERVSREIFEAVAERLKLATREVRSVGALIEGHMRPMFFTAGVPTRRALVRLRRVFGEDVIGLMILFLSDLQATRGPARPEGQLDLARERVSEALKLYCGSVGDHAPPRLLSGTDLMRELGMSPGPALGRMLNRLSEMQDEGDIGNREEAMAAAAKMLDQPG